jgi:hypothetical protein
MGVLRRRLGRAVWFFLLSAAACLASSVAWATCPVLDDLQPGVSCYVLVQAIDVCSQSGTRTLCAPFNTNSLIGSPLTQSQTPPAPGQPPTNPIGFFDPNGNDVTRALLHQIGIDLVYTVPLTLNGPNIAQFISPNKPGTTTTFQTLNVTQGATCTGSIAPITGTNTGTLTITSCSSGIPTVSDTLSGSGIKTGTVITAIAPTNTTAVGTYTVSPSQTVKSTTITAASGKFQSQDFLTLSYQPQISQNKPTTSPNQVFPNAPLGTPSTVYNLLFVSTLNPPASQAGGQLNGFTYLGNNGSVIGANTFFPPAGVPLGVSVIAHEILHGLGAGHDNFAAGPWTAPTGANGSYTAPSGVVLPVPAHPLAGECDPFYPGCAANLMTIGALRTEPSLACVLAPSVLAGGTPPPGCLPPANGLTAQSPGLYAGGADQLTLQMQENSTTLPKSQQTQVVGNANLTPALPGSGLLYQPTINTGFLHPIPFETTKAQAATGGSSTDRVIFDLSRTVGGKPGETLVAWVLTLPQEQTFARPGQYDILAQSRKDLVQSVNYYPDGENKPLMRNIAYQPGADTNPDNPSIGPAGSSPCASTGAACLMVKFQPPGLGAHDTIKFSESILSGGAPITNDDLCKAKITYMFSDGYATTSNFGPCPAKSLPLIASSWRPDLTVPPQVVKSNVLLVDTPLGPPSCTPDADHPTQCLYNPLETALEDANPAELLQPGQSCGGSGTVNHNVTVAANQNCVFTSPCEIQGNVTINGGTFWSDCMVDGNINNNGGRLFLAPSASVGGVVQISGGSGFAISGATLSNNLGIQNLPAGILQPSTVCGTKVNGNLSVQNNASPIEIGGPNCDGNTITNRLQCKNNTGLTVQGNKNPAGQPIQCP